MFQDKTPKSVEGIAGLKQPTTETNASDILELSDFSIKGKPSPYTWRFDFSGVGNIKPNQRPKCCCCGQRLR